MHSRMLFFSGAIALASTTVVFGQAPVELTVKHVLLNNPPPPTAQDLNQAAQAIVSTYGAVGQTLSGNDVLAELDRLRSDLEKCRAELAKFKLQLEIPDDAEAFIFLRGTAAPGAHAVLRFLFGNLQHQEHVAITRLQSLDPSKPELTARWFDDAGYARVAELHAQLRPWLVEATQLRPGMRVFVVIEPANGGGKTELSGFVHGTSASNAVWILPDAETDLQKLQRVPVTDIKTILLLPKEIGEFQQAQQLMSPYRQPNARSISIDWPQPPPANAEFEVAYRQKAPRWRVQYRLHFDDTGVNAERFEGSAFIHNRTAYKWDSVRATLRESGPRQVNYETQNVVLDSQQAGLFPLGPKTWQPTFEQLAVFDATRLKSGAHPQHVGRLKLTGPALVAGQVSIYRGSELSNTVSSENLPREYPLGEAKAISVEFQRRQSVRPYDHLAFEAYFLKNDSMIDQAVTVLVSPSEQGWQFAGDPKGKVSFPVQVKGKQVAVLRLLSVMEQKASSVAHLDQYGLDCVVDGLIALRRGQLQLADEDAQYRELEKRYLFYPVLLDSDLNIFARQSMRDKLAVLRRSIAQITEREEAVQAKIDALLFQPYEDIRVPAH